ncbi:MAG: hypothetical protein LBR80_09825 [Deltaproteobacteria bacterium]|nr:hypothetical protein [Deltaproteobacteria bacterium]
MQMLRYIKFLYETGMGLSDAIVQTRLRLHCHYDLIRLLKHLDGGKPPPPPGGAVYQLVV